MESTLENSITEKINNPLKNEDRKYVDLIICPEVLTIFYLSRITKIDLLTLILLFEKMGTNLYYMFHMLAKKKISFPSESNLLKAVNFCETCDSLLVNPSQKSKISEKDRLVFDELCSSVVDRKYIRVALDDVSEDPIRKIIKTKSLVSKSELDSVIKKYIRKERRRLVKLNQLNTLYDDTNETRISFIDKVAKIMLEKNPDKELNSIKELVILLLEGYRRND